MFIDQDQRTPPIVYFARMRTMPARLIENRTPRVVTPSIESRGKCPICLDIDSQMYVFLGCGHIVCKDCFKLNSDQESKCSLCRKFSKLIKLYI